MIEFAAKIGARADRAEENASDKEERERSKNTTSTWKLGRVLAGVLMRTD